MPADSLAVFNLGFSAGVDGPGQRLVIYCKGCNLACPWCAAPESIAFEPQVLFYRERVSSPSDVVGLCPYEAISSPSLDRDLSKCAVCVTRDCVVSRHPAFELVGEKLTIDDLVEKAIRYRPFYGTHGGVTIGGGEPTSQFAALSSLLAQIKATGTHTAIETNGTHPDLPSLFPLIDLLYIDLKHPDPSRYTGRGAENVLASIASRYRHGGEMIVRIPFIDGFNTDESTVWQFGELLSSVGHVKVELLPYHSRADVKWRACGSVPPSGFATPSEAQIRDAQRVLSTMGLEVMG